MDSPTPARASASPLVSAPISRGPLGTLTALHTRQVVLTSAGPLDWSETPLALARGRRLARDARAAGDFPPAEISAFDGYAIAEAAAPAAGSRFRLCGEAAAGRPFTGEVRAGECVRIFTGAWLPRGARRVLLQEHVAVESDAIRVVQSDARCGFRRRGENHRAGDVVLRAGTQLDPLELALAASAGLAALPVHRPPRVAHLVTGSELVPAGAPAAAGHVFDANSPLIAALTAAAGAELVAQILVPDELTTLAAVACELPAHDVLLISGGAGHGDYDLACVLLERLGFALRVRSVAMRPGKPLVFATAGSRLAFALPGNPLSHWATWHLFVAPALNRLAGDDVAVSPARLSGTLADEWNLAAEERDVFWPARAEPHGTSWHVQPLRFLNSGDLAGVAGANALLLSAAGPARRCAAGSTVEFLLCS